MGILVASGSYPLRINQASDRSIVMPKRNKEYPVSKLDLALKSYEPDVKSAYDRWLEIEANGGDPIAWWSQHNGYRVVDQNEWYAMVHRMRKEDGRY